MSNWARKGMIGHSWEMIFFIMPSQNQYMYIMRNYKPLIVVGAVIIAGIVFYATRPSNRITIELASRNKQVTSMPDSIALKVYVENSGSMDAYMCAGSELKDAVFDYISDLKPNARFVELNYINSSVIPYHGNLNSYIKNLTPVSFAKAGGNKSNTDLRHIFQTLLKRHDSNSVSILVSDCILDIDNHTTDYFGNCQVSLKNTFSEALHRMPNLGVEIVKLESRFSGYWFCGSNKQKLSNVKRPYYIWIIGDANVLAKINKVAPITDVIHGIKEYCAFSPVTQFAYNVDKTRYVVPHNDRISVNLFANLDASLQNDAVLTRVLSYSVNNPGKVKIRTVARISAEDSQYSHVIMTEINQPRELSHVELSFHYPSVPSWVETSNDDFGQNVTKNLDKTTGLKYLVKGVAEAYKDYSVSRGIAFNLKNK